jgi:DNA repair protein RecO (recombination protein O)
MISKTHGIVIKYLKYQESSIIAQVFTEKYGLMPFIVNGIRSPRSKRSIGYFQPFSVLDLIAYMKPNREIQRISEYKFLTPTHNLQQDIRKSSVTLFLSEILGKILKHEQGESHEHLFQFLHQSIIILDQLPDKVENFHIHFLLKLLPFLGLSITHGEELIENMDSEILDEDSQMIHFITKVINSEYGDNIGGTGELRFKSLDRIIKYLRHHTAELNEVKSIKVLHQVFQ